MQKNSCVRKNRDIDDFDINFFLLMLHPHTTARWGIEVHVLKLHRLTVHMYRQKETWNGTLLPTPMRDKNSLYEMTLNISAIYYTLTYLMEFILNSFKESFVYNFFSVDTEGDLALFCGPTMYLSS